MGTYLGPAGELLVWQRGFYGPGSGGRTLARIRFHPDGNDRMVPGEREQPRIIAHLGGRFGVTISIGNPTAAAAAETIFDTSKEQRTDGIKCD